MNDLWWVASVYAPAMVLGSAAIVFLVARYSDRPPARDESEWH